MGSLFLGEFGSYWFLMHQIKALMSLFLDLNKQRGKLEKVKWRTLPLLYFI